jgi:hypothetical protein
MARACVTPWRGGAVRDAAPVLALLPPAPFHFLGISDVHSWLLGN